MDRTHAFRSALSSRILRAAIVALGPTSALAACTGPSSGTTTGGTSSGDVISSGTGHPITDWSGCFEWPATGAQGIECTELQSTNGSGGAASAGGAGGATPTATAATGSGGAGGTSPNGGGAGGMSGKGGAGGGDATPVPPCPAVDQAPASWGLSAYQANSVGGPTATPDGHCCCYTHTYVDCNNGCGRPFLVEAEVRTAPARRVDSKDWYSRGECEPQVADRSREERARLAEAWLRDALLEHASIASFGRFALELIAVGAPPDLIEAAHRAALDEVRHARLCFGLASAYVGAPVSPGPFPFGGHVEVDSDLASVAARAAREGCIGETLAALQAAEQLAHAADPAVRDALAVIAEDEARHAELAWRFVAWAISSGGERVRAAVAAVFDELAPIAPSAESVAEDPEWLAHGRLSEAHREATLARGLVEVVMPSARALRARPRGEANRPIA